MFTKSLRTEGFTLIELMVVVLIIAILILVAIPTFNIARAKVRRRTCQANIRTIDGALSVYLANEEDYPPVSDGADADDLIPYLAPLYINRLTHCPSNGNYTFHSGLTSYIECDSMDGGKHEVPAVD
jgi:type IV pilus assembly protein PilA